MPRLSVIAIRLALLHLLTGFTFGTLLLWNKGVPFGGWVWRLLPVHVEMLLVGWTAQLILGVAYWILPRFSGGSRGNTALAGWAVGLLNAGVLLAAAYGTVSEPAMLAAARVLEAGAALLFALHAWRRVRPTYG